MVSIIYNCVQASRDSWQPNCLIAGRLHLTGTRVYARRGPGRVLADLWVSVRGEVSLKRSTMRRIAFLFVLTLVVALVPAMAETWTFTFTGSTITASGTVDVTGTTATSGSAS